MSEGHNEPCAFCGEKCNGLAADPGMWPVGFCHPDGTGVLRWHHERCLARKLWPLPEAPKDEREELAKMLHEGPRTDMIETAREAADKLIAAGWRRGA